MSGERTNDGFTLAEVLVALVLLTVVIAALAQAGAVGWRGLRASKQSAHALAIAEALLARTGIESGLSVGSSRGVIGKDFSWSIDIHRYRNSSSSPEPLEPYSIDVDVAYPDERGVSHSVHLSSVKLGPAQ